MATFDTHSNRLREWLAEAVATFGLLLTIFGCVAKSPAAVAYAVGLYITAAYWFTASTSFANPAVTLARSLSDTFAGIAPAGVARLLAHKWPECWRPYCSVAGSGGANVRFGSKADIHDIPLMSVIALNPDIGLYQ